MKFAAYTLLMSLFSGVLIAQTTPAKATEKPLSVQLNEHERLLVFVQPGKPVSDRFVKEQLPSLKATIMKMKVPVQVIEISDKAPEAVHITPLLVYMNHQGRSVYQGRYTTVGRVKNFVRTARFIQQASAPQVKPGIAYHKHGRVTVGSPIKITELAGHQPDHYDHGAWTSQAKTWLAAGFTNFKYSEDVVSLAESDRQFYMDIYPYKSENGKLFLSLALFSQFHCHEPIYIETKKPVEGTWDNAAEAFKQAGALLEKATKEQMAKSKYGDDFDILGEEVKVASWEELGLTLPAAPKKAVVSFDPNMKIAEKWELITNENEDRPVIQFNFPKPLQYYSGEVKKVTGHLHLGKGTALHDAKGKIVVDTGSITMGEQDLTDTIRDGEHLNIAKFKTSSFELGSVDTTDKKLAFGRQAQLIMQGKFTMVGKAMDLTVTTSLEPVVNDNGELRLVAISKWKLPLTKVFGITGPDSSEASKSLEYSTYLIFKPAE